MAAESAWEGPEDAPLSEPAGGLGRWLVTVVVVVAVMALDALPVPGLQRWSGQPLMTVLGGSLVLLPLVRGMAAIGRTQERAPARWPAAFYLLANIAWAWFAAARLEGLPMGYSPLVDQPGLAFRLVACATVGGGSSVLWLLAGWVSRSGVGSGPLVIRARSACSPGWWAPSRWEMGWGAGSAGRWPRRYRCGRRWG